MKVTGLNVTGPASLRGYAETSAQRRLEAIQRSQKLKNKVGRQAIVECTECHLPIQPHDRVRAEGGFGSKDLHYATAPCWQKFFQGNKSDTYAVTIWRGTKN